MRYKSHLSPKRRNRRTVSLFNWGRKHTRKGYVGSLGSGHRFIPSNAYHPVKGGKRYGYISRVWSAYRAGAYTTNFYQDFYNSTE